MNHISFSQLYRSEKYEIICRARDTRRVQKSMFYFSACWDFIPMPISTTTWVGEHNAAYLYDLGIRVVSLT